MSAVLELLRPELRELRPYAVEPRRPGVWLNANESPWPAPGDTQALNRYPEPQPAALRARLAGLYGLPAERLLITRGSDDAIDLLIRAFCRPGRDALLVMPPTFGMYAQFAALNAVAVSEHRLDPARDFAFRAEAVLARVRARVRLVFVCSPNNPTGNLQSGEEVARLCRALAGRALVVVDEAYQEFAGTPGCGALLAEHDNLVVLRTLSKAYGLAAARCGVLLGGPELVRRLAGLLPPYPVPAPSVQAALRALTPEALAVQKRRLALLRRERERLRRALAGLPRVRRIWPSAANFLLAEAEAADQVCRNCAAAGVYIRRIADPVVPELLRVTVGTPEENDRFLQVMEAL